MYNAKRLLFNFISDTQSEKFEIVTEAVSQVVVGVCASRQPEIKRKMCMLYLRCGKKILAALTSDLQLVIKKKRHKARLGPSVRKHTDILYRARHDNTHSLKITSQHLA